MHDGVSKHNNSCFIIEGRKQIEKKAQVTFFRRSGDVTRLLQYNCNLLKQEQEVTKEKFCNKMGTTILY